MNLTKRLFALLLAVVMVCSALPVTALATTEGQGETPEVTACTEPECTLNTHGTETPHVYGCNKTGTCKASEGSHDATCPSHPDYVAPETPCTKADGCQAPEGKHDATCPSHPEYKAPEAPVSENCEHGIAKTETCTDCTAAAEKAAAEEAAAQAAAASAARVKAVQDLIDALPATVTNDDEAAAMETAFAAIDEAKAALVGDEVNGLNLTKWNAALSAYDTYKGNPGASVPDTGDVPEATGTLGAGYISNNNGVVTVWGEATGVSKPLTEFRIDLFAGDTKLASTKLNDVSNIFTTHRGALTWHLMVLGEEYDSFWTTKWADGSDNITAALSAKPTKIKLYMNGSNVPVSEATVYENDPDGINSVQWASLISAEMGGKVYSSIQAAVNASGTTKGAQIKVLNDTTETNITVADDRDIVIDLCGKTVTGNFLVYGKATIKNGTITNNSFVSGIEANGASANLTLEDDLTVTSTRHALRLEGGTTTINGGTYTTIGRTGGTETVHAVNAGGAYATTVIIDKGTFNGLRVNGNAENPDSSAALNAQALANVSVYGGTFKGGQNHTVATKDGGAITISAGTYDQDPRVTGVTLGDKKAVKKISDTEYQVVDGTVKNETSGKYYATIQDAVNDAAADNKLVLLDNITETGVKVPVGKDVVIDLSNKTVTGDFVVYGDAVIQNGTIDSTVSGKSGIETNNEANRTLNPTLTATDLTIKSGRHAIRVDGGTVTINGGSYTAANVASNHAVNISDGGNVTIKNGTFTGNNQSGTGAVALRNASSLTIEDGTFTGGSTGSLTVWGNGGTATVKNGTFDSVYADVDITIENGTFGTINKMVNRGISGGTFGTDPSAHVISTKAAMLGQDGKYTIVDAEAQIGEQGYYPLEAAVAAAANSQTVKLLKDRTGAAMSLNDATTATAITLDLNGNNLDGEMTISKEDFTVTIADTATDSNATVSIKIKSDLTKEGHTIGWKNIANNTVAKTVTTTGTYSIGWIPNKYEINFYGNGATGGSMTNLSEVLFTQEVDLTNGFTKTGYHFVKWTMEQGGGGNSYLATEKPSGLASENGATVELYAQWAPNTYNIIFNVSGGTSTATDAITTTATYDGNAVVLPGKPAQFTAPTGKPNFIGWNTQANGKGTTYAPGTAVKNLTAEKDGQVVLYAQWASKLAPTYTITKNNKDYNGKAQDIVLNVTPADATVTLSYTPVGASPKARAAGQAINAGTYDVTVTIGETTNYAGAVFTIPAGFTIKQAPLLVSYAGETIYAGHSPKLEIKVTGFVNGENAKTVPNYKQPEFKKPIPSTIGTHKLEFEGGNPGANYYFVYSHGNLVIKDKIVYVYSPDKLLQTGAPIGMLLMGGVSALAAGAWVTLKKKKYDR